ncbi:hypothetical protein D8I24_6493 [Cupriavidus necator H850]|uniref:hypothetical protein n=1 Tax=Cupriavidus necator TaxID=106590 RepID=UPI001E5F6123|nr:hypothetical protein [Cupriavidus necator]KAI3597677.1 hypothetical protein D8I24_6493 [Cupriavidus necator H850]
MMQSIRDLVANDGYAITFQSMGQYRNALLKAIDESAQQAKRRSGDQLLAEICHNLTLAMQAAWIEWEHGGGADAAMQWIQNTLIGPGLIPDEDEPHGTQAQAYFDANTDPMPNADRLDKLAAENPDDAAVDRFAIELKKKLAKAREKGRCGWKTCPPADLSRMLREHVEKGDPRDVANFCAFLWALGQPISPSAACFELSLVPPNGATLPANPAPHQFSSQAPAICLSGRELLECLEIAAPDALPAGIDANHEQMDTELFIGRLSGAKDDDGKDSGPGIYAWHVEYPEEGVIPLRLDSETRAAIDASLRASKEGA